MRSEADISTGRIRSVEVLRGLAALAVTWFHLTNTYDAHWVCESGRFGWLGVEDFLLYLGSSFHFLLFEAMTTFASWIFGTICLGASLDWNHRTS
jgi:hypothetical protein